MFLYEYRMVELEVLLYRINHYAFEQEYEVHERLYAKDLN
jgi:hypothetical protein